jgi:cell division protein FtsB
MARDRARRDAVTRPIYPQIVKPQAWPETKPASASDAGTDSTEADNVPESKQAPATRVFPIAMLVMIGVNFGAIVGLVGWPVLQALEVVDKPVIEVVQRDQANSISKLDATVQSLNAAVAELNARVASHGDRQEATFRYMTEIDAAFGALRTSMHEMRAAQNAENESWHQPVAELTAAATKARSDIVRLRASLDELSRLRQPEAAAPRARINRIEQTMAQHELPGAIRGSIQAPGERPRSLASRETSSAADGHIIDLTPAR